MVRAVSVSRDADCDGARSVVTERAPPLTGSVGDGATAATELHREDEQRRLRIATAKRRQNMQRDGESSADYVSQRQRQNMHRHGESSADYAELRQRNSSA